MLEHELDVLVGEGHEVGADEGHDAVQHGRLHQVHVPDPPVQPWGSEQHRAGTLSDP